MCKLNTAVSDHSQGVSGAATRHFVRALVSESFEVIDHELDEVKLHEQALLQSPAAQPLGHQS